MQTEQSWDLNIMPQFVTATPNQSPSNARPIWFRLFLLWLLSATSSKWPALGVLCISQRNANPSVPQEMQSNHLSSNQTNTRKGAASFSSMNMKKLAIENENGYHVRRLSAIFGKEDAGDGARLSVGGYGFFI